MCTRVGGRMRRWIVSLVAIIFASAIASDAHAQGNLRASPTGGRSVLMGGTGIALGRDAAAPFLNPATIARIDDSGVAFSANFYTFTTAQFQNFHQPGPVDTAQFGALNLPNTNLSRGRIDGLPTTLCLFLKIGRAHGPESDTYNRRARRPRLSACLGNVERQLFDATGQSYIADAADLHTIQALSITHRWNRLYIGPTYSFYLTDRLAVGASLDVISTTTASTWSVDTLTSRGSATIAASGFDTSYNAYSIDAAALLGIIYHIDPHEVVGVSVSTPAVHILGGYKATSTIADVTRGSSVAITAANGGFVAQPPLRIGVGLGAEFARIRVEGDASLWIPVQPFARAEATGTQTASVNGVASSRSFNQIIDVNADTIVDAGFGFEWYVSRAISLLGGASTDWSALGELSATPPPGTLAESRVHRLAASFGVGTHGLATELLLGTELSYGWGQSVAVDPYVDPPRLALVDERLFGVMLVVAGRTSLALVRDTLSRVIGAQP